MRKYREEDTERKGTGDTKKQERLLEAMGKIDEDLVADALQDGRRKKKGSWVSWGIAAAACLALVIFVGAEFILKDAPGGGPDDGPTQEMAANESPSETETLSGAPAESGTKESETGQETEEDGISGTGDGREKEILEPDDPEELPMLAVGEFLYEGGGYEGLMAHDISELTCENPWREDMELPALPVYENALTYDEHYYRASGADFDAMRERLLTVADRLGLDLDKLTVGDNAPDEEAQKIIREKLEGDEIEEALKPTAVTAEADGIRIEVDMQMRTHISFDPERALPEEYHFTYESTYEELAAVAGYLQETYAELLHMEKPRAVIGYGDYTYAGERRFNHLEFYDTAGSSVDQILNYNFNRVEFCRGEDGKLSSVWISQPDLSKLVGNYPIISAEEAKELLLSGNCITSVPYEVPGEEYIRRVELVYRNGDYEKYYMPYYRFYIELPEEERDHGLKDYGAYYVPAVEGSYLTDMPTWDGSFN